MRGEYFGSALLIVAVVELPPRARRILTKRQPQITDRGTTSACAENTRHALGIATPIWNYLRVRGEYSRLQNIQNEREELPPRARRIPLQHLPKIRQGGTTSACAENTPPETQPNQAHRNYLRVRGEYRFSWATSTIGTELPPRARRIPSDDKHGHH